MIEKSISQARWQQAAEVLVLATLFALVLLLEGSPRVCAQQLSLRHYNVGDGLAQSNVTAILQDRKGYIWFGTFEGLSRFDGYRFTNYSIQDGLSHLLINDLTEDRHGHLWVATNGGGVARLLEAPQQGDSAAQRQRFVSYKVGESGAVNNVNEMIFDVNNRLWCITDDGVYRAQVSERLGEPKFERLMPSVPFLLSATLVDRRGRLWIGNGRELIQIVDDEFHKYGAAEALGGYNITGLTEDSQGRLYLVNRRELFVFTEPAVGVKGRWERLPLPLTQNEEVLSMIADLEAGLWLGTSKGLIRYRDGQVTRYASAQGLVGNVGRALAQDREGSLWLSTESGVYQLTGEMIVSYKQAEDLPERNVLKVIEGPEGRIYAITGGKGIVEIVDGRPALIPGSEASPFNAIRNILLDSRGDWWAKTDKQLFRFPGPRLELRRDKKAADGFSRSQNLSRGLHEDQAGRVWISGYTDETNLLYRFDPQRAERPSVERITLASEQEIHSPSAILSDRWGALWLAMHEQLVRMRDGKITFLRPTAGLPETYPRAFFSDSRGRLWIGLRFGGVSVTEDPESDQPKFINYSTRDGLASNSVFSITEDDAGRIYLGTGRGLDQLDLLTGRVRHFTTADGLAGTWINHVLKDSRGNIWIATSTGLSKLNLRAERASDYLPPVYVSRIQVAGEELSLPETGALEVPELELTPSRNNLLIEYVGVSFQADGRLRYQYQLEGVDQGWNAPVEQQAVNYGRLSPGSYRFMVRAVTQDGKTSERPAVIQFRILPPIWQRWWFVSLAAMLVGLAAYRFYRYRVARLIELERVRTRIATDLHDDIGSNLSRIAILSEVATQQVDKADAPVIEPLSLIAATSRELVDAMSDIVWAINPDKDHIGDLAQRMRRFASDVFTARNIAFHFLAPSAEAFLKVSADVRRQVFLIFKESVNNAVRHSACTEVNIALRLEGSWLSLTFKDNGKGFDAACVSDGNGLTNMASRAKSLGGTLKIVSNAGAGTAVTLKAPLVATAKAYNTRLHRE